MQWMNLCMSLLYDDARQQASAQKKNPIGNNRMQSICDSKPAQNASTALRYVYEIIK